MKKLLLIAMVGALAGSVFADDETLVVEKSWTPIQINIASPIGLPWDTDWDVYGLRLSLPFGYSDTVGGVDLGLVGLARGNVYGLQLNGFNHTEGTFEGVQLGVLVNYAAKSAYGVQLSGLLNWITEDSSGIQLGTLNLAGVYSGIQFGVLLNWNDGQTTGLNISCINAFQADAAGCDIGVVNFCNGSFRGCQIGCFNMIYGPSEGVQLGVFNAAEHNSGVQIGLLNLNVRGSMPIMAIVNANFR